MSELLEVDLHHTAGPLTLRARFRIEARRAALWGPSGSGKSTLLRLAAGLTKPRAGVIRLGGRTLLDAGAGIFLAPGARGVGFLTQTPALFPHLSVDANLRFGLKGLPAGEQRRRTGELAALFGIAPLLARSPARLSGGERQRVALARALAPQPRLLLLDEPFSALDLPGKTALWADLAPYLQARDIATLLVSHDPSEVWAQSETVVRIENGVATEQGPPAAMLGQEREQLLRLLALS